GVILRNISSASADITIVTNAMSAAVPFSPQVYHIAVGGTVTWINKDASGTAHTVTSNVTGQFDSGTLTTEATFAHTFATVGTYDYHCTPHPQMWGEITVS
ncbi:MAG TPA: plastocyanin/azurin family copper-binding protein, partial [Thermoplasmata archaeon]|nr:plastocyanin/azurin family copper-binding protein [Thermoplasmata archaeon]